MALNLSERFHRGREIITQASPSKLVIAGSILAAATALLIVFMVMSGPQASYAPLFTRLSPEDAGSIVTELKTRGIEYNLLADGTAIEVPEALAQELRLDFAMKGLPAKGNVGFEVFDNQKLGATELQQKTNLLRAVQGELERTIMTMPEIESARIHLAVPDESLFIEDKKPSTAAVMISLRRGATLEKPQLLGIVHLVTSAVDGLTADNVSVIDSEGGLLWSKDLNKPGLLNDDQLKQKRAYEENLRNRINAMLEKIVGPGKVTTQVNAELDLKEVVTNEDIYDPERVAVRSEQKIKEQSTGPGRAMAGIPNATYELGTANRQNSGAGGNQEQYSRTEETNNYEITNIKRQTVSSAGDLKKVTVSVMVDGTYVENADGEKVFTPLPQEQLTKLTQAVKNIVGFDEARGDSVAVDSMEFFRQTGESMPLWYMILVDLYKEFSKPLFNLFLIILFFFFVVRPIMNWLKKEVEPAGSGADPAVLPEYPSSGPSFGDGLPLPEAPGMALSMAANEIEDEKSPIAEDEYDQIPPMDEPPTYDQEEPEEAPKQLAYGNLNRENIMPMAKENLERTVGLLRDWIEQKPVEQPDSKNA